MNSSEVIMMIIFKIRRIFYIHCCKNLHIFVKLEMQPLLRPRWRQVVVQCTLEYKQLDMCTQNVKCCSAQPKSSLPNHKTKQEGKV